MVQFSKRHASADMTHKHFFVMREFLWGAIAGAFGEGMMHPVDTVKTRIQSQAILSASQKPKSIQQMVRAVWVADGLRGDTLGSVVYVPCEVMKQRMQVQGTMASWSSVVMKDNIAMKPGIQMYGYYTGMFHAGCSIWEEQGLRGLYAGWYREMCGECPVCAKTGHPLQFCPSRDEFSTFVREHSHNMCFSNQGPLQPSPNTYSPAWRNSHYDSWNNIQAPNQAFAPPPQQESFDTTLEDTLKLLAQNNLQFQQSTSSIIQNHSLALGWT